MKGILGLAELKLAVTGAAPIRVDTLEYFGSLGININEVYGMSESCAACTMSTDKAHLWGSCGFQMPGVEVKAFKIEASGKVECPRAASLDQIDEEFQGELCFRGRSIMMGYLAQPSLGAAHVQEAPATKETTWKDRPTRLLSEILVQGLGRFAVDPQCAAWVLCLSRAGRAQDRRHHRFRRLAALRRQGYDHEDRDGQDHRTI